MQATKKLDGPNDFLFTYGDRQGYPVFPPPSPPKKAQEAEARGDVAAEGNRAIARLHGSTLRASAPPAAYLWTKNG